jgi:hypothetical protein
MIGIISNLYNWSTAGKWLAAGLLWWQIINWSGILEAKSWLWISENLRNIVTPVVVMAISGLFAPSPLVIATLVVAVFSIVWTTLYFRPHNATMATA